MADKAYSKFNLFIRSLLFSIYSSLAIGIYGTGMTLFLWPFSPEARHKVIRHFLKNYFRVLKFLCHIDVDIQGLENIPHNRAGIIMCKHQSLWETFMLPLIFKYPTIIVKRELLWVPFFGWGLSLAGPIAINRRQKSSAMQQIIDQGTKCLNEGRFILIFPEGTRTPYGSVGNYRLGGTRLAVSTAHPILPIAHNAGKFWAKRQFIKKPGTVKMVIGPLIESKGLTPEELLASTKTWIEKTMVSL